MRLNRGGYLIREGFRSIGTHGFMSFASVTIIMLCLIIMGSVSLLSVNIDYLIADLEQQNEIVCFVSDEAANDEAAIKQVGADISAIDNVSSAEFVSRDAAFEQFTTNYDKTLMEGIDSDVLRHRYIVHLVDIALMAETESVLEDVPNVAKVKAHLDYAESFITVRNIVTVISLALIVMLVFVCVFIMSNTIKLATFGRREEIAIMKMVGAANGFIRLPFVIEGLVLGALGGGLAFVAEWGIYNGLTGKLVTSLTGSFINAVPFESLAMTVLIAFVGTGVLVGVFGGVNAIRNYLKV